MPETAVATPVKVKKLGHLVYEVSNLERSVQFWTEIMGFQISDRNEKGMVFLRYGSDHHAIGLIELAGRTRSPEGQSLQMSHLAMEVADVETLFRCRDYLKERGITFTFEGRKGGGGNMGIEFEDPDGYGFELYAGMDQIGPDGTSRPASQWDRVKTLEDAVARPLPGSW